MEVATTTWRTEHAPVVALLVGARTQRRLPLSQPLWGGDLGETDGRGAPKARAPGEWGHHLRLLPLSLVSRASFASSSFGLGLGLGLGLDHGLGKRRPYATISRN